MAVQRLRESEYQPLLRRARWFLRHHPDVMLLADRGFANHELMQWLRHSRWHYCLRLPCDVFIHTSRRYPVIVKTLYPPLGEARLYQNIGLWLDGTHRCNLVLATVQGAKESWAVITDQSPTLQTLWQYAMRFQVEELFLEAQVWRIRVGRFTIALCRCPRTPLFGCCCCLVVCHDDWDGGATGRLAPTSRPALATWH